jgi:succinate dehydrogenase / fumarate reductase flavoprotein subunit
MHRTDSANVLIVGTGAAGWRAAIAATQAGVEARLIGKRPQLDPHTVLASGGINASLGTRGPDDSHPEEAAGTLVTEAVRGEGGRLLNAAGERYMERYDPERLELSSRDRVALANYTEIVEGRAGPHGGVFLDISHRGKAYITEKLPHMYRQFIEWQMLDISREPMEVAPTAHYTRGGIVIDPETHATDVRGLFAAGECVGGVHGANRLGGNSLGEAIIAGRRSGESAAAFALEGERVTRSRRAIDESLAELDDLTRPGDELARPLQRHLRDVMWERCGVVRDESGLRIGLEEIASLRAAATGVDVRPGDEGWADLAHALDLRGALVVAEATLRSAIERRESRGGHQRADYPELDPALRVNLHIDARMRPWAEPVPPIPSSLREWAERPVELTADWLLE